MDKHAKTYTIRMVVAFIFYTVLLFGSITAIQTFEMPAPLAAMLAILPVLPAIAVLFIIVAFVRTRDEVQQKIIMESTLWGMGIVAIASFTYGFLQNVLPLPEISLIWVLPALLGIPGIAQVFVRMRYQ